MRTAADWITILVKCGVSPDAAVKWSDTFADGIKDDTFSGDAELAAFLGQVLVECDLLTRFSENLSYSAGRLCEVWPRRFPTVESALPYSHNAKALANKVYGGRLGNTEPDDGWNYRGFGMIQITGRNNYKSIGDAIGQDLIGDPSLLCDYSISLAAAIAFWKMEVTYSDGCTCADITKCVNGGEEGLAQREEITNKALEALS